MPIAPWRATCIQMNSALATQAPDPDSAWRVIEGNVARAVGMIEAACTGPEPPRLVVTPEFGFQGPPHGGTVADWIGKACCPVPGRITAPLQEAARRHGIYIGGNQFETDPRWPGRFFNSCFLIDPGGEVILRFRRINTASWPSPHDFMDDYVGAMGPEGTFPVVETELGRIAMLACGEIAVPEVARVLMMRGAEILLHPTNEDHNPAQEAAKTARAAENMAYVVSANVAGGIGFSADGSVLGGRSRIVDFRGRTLAFDPGTAESTSVSAVIDVEGSRAARRDLGMGNTLLRSRFEMYRDHYAKARFYPANGFLETPMPESGAAAPVVAEAMRRMIEAGVVVAEEPGPAKALAAE